MSWLNDFNYTPKGAAEIFGIFFWLVACIIALGILAFENSVADDTAKLVHVWAQFVTGPWPRWEEAAINRKSVGFAGGVLFRSLLVVVPIYGIFDIFKRVVRLEREETMKFLDILRLRDRAIKNELMNEVPIERRDSASKSYDKAFEEGSKRFTEGHLRDLFGKEKADKIIKSEFETRHD